VLEGHWIILKWGVKVGLGKMPGVAGLSKETEIRELEFPHKVLAFRQAPLVIIPLQARVDKEKTRHNQAAHKEKYQKCG
jgi:hypothetical protein